MRIYLAARYSRRLELCGYRAALEARGHVVTSRWLNGSHQLDDNGQPIGDDGEAFVELDGQWSAEAPAQLREKFAQDDRDDVLAAEHLIAFTEMPRTSNSRGGRHVEFGLALGSGIPVTVIGPRENVFCHLPEIFWYPTFAQYLGEMDSRMATAAAGGAA